MMLFMSAADTYKGQEVQERKGVLLVQEQLDSFESRLHFHPRGSRIQLETETTTGKDQLPSDVATATDLLFTTLFFRGGNEEGYLFCTVSVLSRDSQMQGYQA